MKKTNEDEVKVLKWRLSEKPTVESITQLLQTGIITKDEARQILLDETEINSKDFSDVLEEIKLLRTLVLEVASKEPNTIIKIIESSPIVIRDYTRPWNNPYIAYCSSAAGSTYTTGTNSMSTGMYNAVNLLATAGGSDLPIN